jgi:hypothetical protein
MKAVDLVTNAIAEQEQQQQAAYDKENDLSTLDGLERFTAKTRVMLSKVIERVDQIKQDLLLFERDLTDKKFTLAVLNYSDPQLHKACYRYKEILNEVRWDIKTQYDHLEAELQQRYEECRKLSEVIEWLDAKRAAYAVPKSANHGGNNSTAEPLQAVTEQTSAKQVGKVWSEKQSGVLFQSAKAQEDVSLPADCRRVDDASMQATSGMK